MSKSSKINFVCPICEREIPKELIEKHHIIPKSKGGKETEQVCVNCGDMIHKLIPLKYLRTTYNSIETVKNHPEIQKWAAWAKKRPHFSVCMANKKRKR
jgi:hypothetical protein